MRLGFKIEAKASNSNARAARMKTLHNDVQTPIFMPVGTRATVRTQTNEHLEALGAQIILANTYHLLIRPGMEVFKKIGGIHRFMNFKKSVLTDSGGFQIFSLPHSRSMGEEGAEFRSYWDGNKFLLTPELSIEMQKAIGSDIMMVLDQCIPSTSGREESVEAMHLTHRWAQRSLKARGESLQSLFAIVQGACFEDLRKESADFLTQIEGFDGYAIGGLAVGETKSEREDMTELTTQLLPKNFPRYLMGVGTPIDLLEAVHRGVDMFDCILPTAWAQQGVVFTSHGKIDLRRTVHQLSESKLDAKCTCNACTFYSRAYLHHLVKTKEVLGWQLLSTHNLKFYMDLMREMRMHILQDTFYEFYKIKRIELARADVDNPPIIKKKGKTKIKTSILGDYQIVDQTEEKTHQTFSSIQQISSGEIMHSINLPDEEAHSLYIDQSMILKKALLPSQQNLVVWDVGLGAAHNAMALIRGLEPLSLQRPVELYSFERDLHPLKLALTHIKKFSHLRNPAPHVLIAKKLYVDDKIQWHLIEGDFAERFREAPAPDIVFYDPFSYKVDTPLWSYDFFRQLHDYFEKDCELFTYTNSTAVRSSLLAAGFYIARGIATPPKKATTIAVRAHSSHLFERDYLDQKWLERRSRSDSQFTHEIQGPLLMQLEAKLKAHPQFKMETK